MSLIYSFLDDNVYSADDVSRVFKRLTTQGVSLFNYAEGDNVLEQLNEAVSELTSSGVELYNFDACRVVYDSENDKFSISVGTAFMCDGTTITIDTEAYDITETVKEIRKTSTDDIYVSFFRNTPDNTIDILVETDNTHYNSEYAVKLAKIFSDNSVFDERPIAKTKLAPCSANVIQEMRVNCGLLLYYDTGVQRKSAVLSNVFPGATKVIINGILMDIQRVDDPNGEGLVFKRAYNENSSNDAMAAFNFSSDGLEVWATIGYNSEHANGWQLMIF